MSRLTDEILGFAINQLSEVEEGEVRPTAEQHRALIPSGERWGRGL